MMKVLYDQMVAMAEEQGILGTVWNEWETNWTGVEIDVTTRRAGGGGLIGGVGNEMGQGGAGGRRLARISTTLHYYCYNVQLIKQSPDLIPQ